jgi:hypothetical protein
MQVSMIEVIPIFLAVLLWEKWFVLWRERSWVYMWVPPHPKEYARGGVLINVSLFCESMRSKSQLVPCCLHGCQWLSASLSSIRM